MGPDEPAHIHRANLPLLGHLLGTRKEDSSGIYGGGLINVAVAEAMPPYMRIVGTSDVVQRADYVKTHDLRWDGRTVFAVYPNTAVYPPFFYIPQTIALAVGKFAGLPVVRTLYLARGTNALACLAIGIWALFIAGRARPAIFTILMMPMSVALYAMVTQDGLCLATTALGCAFITSAVSDRRKMTLGEVCGAAVCFALVGMSKPPYAVFALVLLAAPVVRPKWKYWASAAALAASIGWAAWMALAVETNLNPDLFDPAGQVRFLVDHPRAVFAIAKQTLSMHISHYIREFIGVLGWLDTPLPSSFYPVAGVALVLSFTLCMSRERRSAMTVMSLTAAVISVALIFGALYVTWTPVGAPVVQGVQGRYFLPVALVLVLTILHDKPLFQAGQVTERVASLVVLGFPVLSLMVTERAVIVRYYLG